MELYILSKQDLSILSICKLADYQINLDEETNAKSTFTLMKTNGLKKGNYMTLNGLYRQFIFVIDDVQTEKESDVVTVTALDISNVFNRKVIEKNIDTMKSKSIEEFLANTISENFVNSDDTALNVNYIEIYWHTNTQGNVATNAENGLYNFHTFLINCRQYKNIYTDFKLENLGNPQTVEGKRISVEAKNRKIVDIMLEGESQQATRSGKNLFDSSQIVNVSDYIVANGTGIKIIKTTNGRMSPLYNISLKANTEYTISCNLTSTTTYPTMYCQWRTNDGSTLWLPNLPNGSTTFKPSKDIVGVIFYLQHTDTDGTYVELTNLQIEKGSTATDYELYGVMPSPDYPSEIENIEGNIEFKVTNGLEETGENYQEQVATFPLSEGQKLMEGSYLADDGIHHNFKEGLANGTSTTFEDAKENGKFYCNQKASGNLEGKTIAFDTEVTDAIVQYELAEEEIVPYTVEQQEAWNNIKNLTLFEGVNHISSDANMVLKYYPLESVGLKFVLRIDIENKQETTKLIDTTLPEVTDYNKVYEEDVTAKVTAYIRENNTEYNLYLKTDRTTTTNKNDPDRASGKIEVISVDTVENAPEEALNVMKGNNYKHLVEFKIAKTSKLMDITELHIGRPIRIKTDDDIYDSYISAITLSDENFVYFKSGSLRITLLDKLKKSNDSAGNKLDVSGGKITGNLNINGILKNNNKTILDLTYPIGSIYLSIKNTNPSSLFGGIWEAWGSGRVPVGVDTTQTEFASVEKTGGEKTHELTINQIPSHQHNIQGANSSGSSVNWTDRAVSYSLDAVGYNAGVRTNYQGGSEAHNNLQPYITCYMWKRIS